MWTSAAIRRDGRLQEQGNREFRAFFQRDKFLAAHRPGAVSDQGKGLAESDIDGKQDNKQENGEGISGNHLLLLITTVRL